MSSKKITIIDYGSGNLLSVQRGFEYFGAEAIITSDPKKILRAEKLVLPGVGAFPFGMKSLENLELMDPIKQVVSNMVPILAICLGMQLLFESSTEFEGASGLAVIDGEVTEVPNLDIFGAKLKRPHIGWNKIAPVAPNYSWENSILRGIKVDSAVYFVHSFMAVPKIKTECIANTEYGGNLLTAVIQKENITGCQFHPEKSGLVGLKIIENFLKF